MNREPKQNQEQEARSVKKDFSEEKSTGIAGFQSPKNSPQGRITNQLRAIQDQSFQAKMTTQLRKIPTEESGEEEKVLQGKFETAKEHSAGSAAAETPNNTGLPHRLKSGIEHLSGYAMDDVKVHYNSAKPAQLNAHAYAQGTDIHIASGQEQHLAHEAWHVVQQKQGRVAATRQLRERGIPINDDSALEREADIMGQKALQLNAPVSQLIAKTAASTIVQRVKGKNTPVAPVVPEFSIDNLQFASEHGRTIGSLYFCDGTNYYRIRLNHPDGPTIDAPKPVVDVKRYFPKDNSYGFLRINRRGEFADPSRPIPRRIVNKWVKDDKVSETPKKGRYIIEFFEPRLVDMGTQQEVYYVGGYHSSRGTVAMIRSKINQNDINVLYQLISDGAGNGQLKQEILDQGLSKRLRQ